MSPVEPDGKTPGTEPSDGVGVAAPEAAPASAIPASAPAPVVIPELDTGYTPSGVPTFEGVREKIETRYGTALGSIELAEETPEGRSATDQYEARKKAATAKLDEIRAAMHESESGPDSGHTAAD